MVKKNRAERWWDVTDHSKEASAKKDGGRDICQGKLGGIKVLNRPNRESSLETLTEAAVCRGNTGRNGHEGREKRRTKLWGNSRNNGRKNRYATAPWKNLGRKL